MSIGDQIVFSSKPWVCRVLIERIDPSVSDSHTFKINPRIVVELEVAGNVRDIVTGVAFTGYVEGPLFILRVLVHEIMEEGCKVRSDGAL